MIRGNVSRIVRGMRNIFRKICNILFLQYIRYLMVSVELAMSDTVAQDGCPCVAMPLIPKALRGNTSQVEPEQD